MPFLPRKLVVWHRLRHPRGGMSVRVCACVCVLIARRADPETRGDRPHAPRGYGQKSRAKAKAEARRKKTQVEQVTEEGAAATQARQSANKRTVNRQPTTNKRRKTGDSEIS